MTQARVLDERAQQLYDEGARRLSDGWDDDAGLIREESAYGVVHSSRASLAYAEVLLREGSAAGVDRARLILRNVAAMQETREGDAHYGNFLWYRENAVVTDLNAVEFVLDVLNTIVREHEAALGDDALAVVRGMIALGLREIDRLAVDLSYTNIALSDISNSVLGGEAVGEQQFVERGQRRLDEWIAYTNRSGAPHEYNSPTYLAVDIARMAALAEGTRDPRIAATARLAEERLWLHVAAHYHPELAQIAGPHSRSYRDGWTGAGGYLKLLLWRLLGDDALRKPTPYFPTGREEGFTGVALATFHCPDAALELLREKRYPYETIETTSAAFGSDITTYMTESYALGTSSRPYEVGVRPEPSLQLNSTLLYFRRDGDPGYGVLSARYLVQDRAQPPPPSDDVWDQGQHAGAQHRNRAIVSYGLRPRARPIHSCRLSVRVLGVTANSEVWCGERRVTSYPARVAPLTPIVVAEGDVYFAIIPLTPTDMGYDTPIELGLNGMMLTLDIYNYRGPAKTFWEYGSQAGAFYKGNVRNAYVLEVAERREFADIATFRAHIAAARIDDATDSSGERAITYASDGGSIAMRYSLLDMRMIERRYDGVPFAAPASRARAVDRGGIQLSLGADGVMKVSRGE